MMWWQRGLLLVFAAHGGAVAGSLREAHAFALYWLVVTWILQLIGSFARRKM